MTPQPPEQPRTAAGRALLEWRSIPRIPARYILAIEAEAASVTKYHSHNPDVCDGCANVILMATAEPVELREKALTASGTRRLYSSGDVTLDADVFDELLEAAIIASGLDAPAAAAPDPVASPRSRPSHWMPCGRAHPSNSHKEWLSRIELFWQYNGVLVDEEVE